MSIAGAILLLVAQSSWAQQVAPQADTAPPAVPPGQIAPQPLVNGGAGGYGAAQLFSPFPKEGALVPPSFAVPGLKPAAEAPRALAVTLGVAGHEQFSDNVYSTSSSTRSDFITSGDTSVGVDVDTRRMKGGLKYDVGYDKYATNSQLDGFRQDGIGLFDVEVIDQRLFLNGRASVSQQSISPSGPATAGTRTAAANLVTVYTGSIAPRFQQRFSDLALAQIAYHHDETRYQNASQATPPATSTTVTAANLNASQTDGGRLEVRSGESFTRLLWDYTGDVNRNTVSGNTFDQISHTVGTEYRVTADFGLLAAAGDDYLHSTVVDVSQYGGGFFNAGVHWTPSPNVDLRVGAGRRYDKTDYIALASYWPGPRTVIRLSTDSGVTTDALSFEQALNAVQRDETGGFISPFTGLAANPSASPFARSNGIYLRRDSDLVVRYDEARDSVAVTARVAEQQLLGATTTLNSPALAGATTGSTTTVLGAYLSWMHYFTPAFTGMAVVSEFDTIGNGVVGRLKQRKGSLSLNYSLNPTLMGTLGYDVAATIPSPSAATSSATAISGTVIENMIAVGLHKTF